MNHNVNTSGIDDCSYQLSLIINNLEDKYQNIVNSFNTIENSISILKSWDGSDASELFTEKIESNFGLYGRQYTTQLLAYKYIWNIHVNYNREADFSDIIMDGINNLNTFRNSLDITNEELENYIKLIELQLGVSYDGNLIHFFNGLKNNPAWLEIKNASNDAVLKKQNDEIYVKYRSKDGEPDLVDFALDELGNKFLATLYSTKYACWYKENRSGANPDDEWCAEFVTYILDKSGNDDKLGAYLACEIGASNAQNNKNGVWHSANSGYQPQRGDIFFKSDHTGIVVASDENYIYTIEGNTAQDDGLYYVRDGAQNNKGGFVNTRVRSMSDYVNLGFYTPNVTLNQSGVQQSRDTNLSDEYLSVKLAINDKFNLHRIAGGH